MKTWLKKRYLESINKKIAKANLSNHYIFEYINKNKLFKDIEFLVLDIETTGLNYKKDRILSIGYTVIKNSRIIISKSNHHFIKFNDEIPDETVAIHGIMEQKAKKGDNIKDIFPIILEELKGRILVAHHTPIEINFLTQAAKRNYKIKIPFHIVDTMQLGFRINYMKSKQSKKGSFSLFNLRKSYKLPAYRAHNALSDSIATAELLLAQINELTSLLNRDVQFKDIIFKKY